MRSTRFLTLTTKPFKLEGSVLQVNADAGNGKLKVEVLNGDGRTIHGFDAAACEPITTDTFRAQVTWRGKSLKELFGRKIRLRFHLTRANLFAFQVTN